MNLTGAVSKRDNVKYHKFLKSLTQGKKAWKYIENSKGGRDETKALREHYNGSSEGKLLMNITKADLKDLYFKRQEIFSFKKYVNRLK